MISLELSLKHLTWSNQNFFAYFGQMPDEVFALRAAEGEWPVGQILTHFAGSGEWYRYCLNGGMWTDLKPITTAAIALEYLPIMASLDATLLENLSLADDQLEIEGENGIIHATRSLILSQAVMHSAEHKGQIATILKQHGRHIDLDALDVWSFISESKTNE
ncbi:MAG: DinB family protein [Actinomycetes bacterium]